MDAFKACWEGKPAPMPLLPSNGENVLPTIHSSDLVTMVTRLLTPEICPTVAAQTRHMLAVDNGRSTLQQLLRTVSQTMSSGEVEVLSEDDTLLLSNDFLAIHQCMEPAAADILMKGHWSCRSGMVAEVDMLVSQFKSAHGLVPCRLIVNGPPLCGKTRLTQELASYYSVPIIDIQQAVVEASAVPEEARPMEEWGALASENEEGERTVVALADVPPEVLPSVVQWKLRQKEYSCRGWILDAFPTNKTVATAIFAVPPPDVTEGEEPPPEEDPPKPPELHTEIAPSNVIWMECDDDALVARFVKLEDAERREGYTDDEETFRAAIASYRTMEGGEPEDTGGKKGAPAEVEASARELFQEASPDGMVVTQPVGLWPDTSAGVREHLGAPMNFAGPGHLLSDDWVEPVEEVTRTRGYCMLCAD